MNLTKTTLRVLAPIFILLATTLALVLTMAGTAQAALDDKRSDTYEAELTLSSLAVGLAENGNVIASSQPGSSEVKSNGLFKNLLKDDGQLALGKKYDELLQAKNTSTEEPEYLRVSVRKYWKDEDGNKDTMLSPELIELEWALDGWKKDESASTTEQTVLYSTAPVDPQKALTFITGLRISPDVLNDVTFEALEKGAGGSTVTFITSDFDYDKCKFVLEVEVAAVQTHNSTEAIKSAWGVDPRDLGISEVD